jgi:hypothetical protein
VNKIFVLKGVVKMNEISFTGIGKLDDKDMEISFKGRDVIFDQSDKNNPTIIIKLIPNKENNWFEIIS